MNYLFIAFTCGLFYLAPTIEDWLCAVLVVSASYASLFLWRKAGSGGIPLLPVYALLHIPFYAMPYANGHTGVMSYEFAGRLVAATTVTVFLLSCTLPWIYLQRRLSAAPTTLLALNLSHRTIHILLALIGGSIVFQSGLLTQWFGTSGAVWGILRAFLLNGGAVALFCLSYFAGMGVLSIAHRVLFFLLAGVFFSLQLQSLYLITVGQFLVLGLVGYTLAARRLPWRLIIASSILLAILQAGKPEVRATYADGLAERPPAVSLLGEWLSVGVASIFDDGPTVSEGPSLSDRVSLTQMVLLAQERAPSRVDFLNGESYLGIPALLVPRAIWPSRPNTSELLVKLNIHFGLLSRESAETTSIGWGVIAEAYANFGFIGVAIVGTLIGLVLGWVQMRTANYPILSARGMFCLLLIFSLTAMEASLAQIVTSILQASVALICFAYIVMSRSASFSHGAAPQSVSSLPPT